METLTIILLIGAIGFYVASVIMRSKEIHWMALIVSVCGLCAVLIDPMFDSDKTALLLILVPYAYVILMSTLRIMGLSGGSR